MWYGYVRRCGLVVLLDQTVRKGRVEESIDVEIGGYEMVVPLVVPPTTALSAPHTGLVENEGKDIQRLFHLLQLALALVVLFPDPLRRISSSIQTLAPLQMNSP